MSLCACDSERKPKNTEEIHFERFVFLFRFFFLVLWITDRMIDVTCARLANSANGFLFNLSYFFALYSSLELVKFLIDSCDPVSGRFVVLSCTRLRYNSNKIEWKTKLHFEKKALAKKSSNLYLSVYFYCYKLYVRVFTP